MSVELVHASEARGYEVSGSMLLMDGASIHVSWGEGVAL